MYDIESNNYIDKRYNYLITQNDVILLFEQASINNSRTKMDYYLNNYQIDGKCLDHDVFNQMYKNGLYSNCWYWLKLGFKPNPTHPFYSYYESFFTLMTIA